MENIKVYRAEICCGSRIKGMSGNESPLNDILRIARWLEELEDEEFDFPESLIARVSYNHGEWEYYALDIDDPEIKVELPRSLYAAAVKLF